ncbi:MAG: iron-containing redox enzyme family protein [Nitrosopumilales archaeon]|nr:iron-containing redox enzyme family protein [Nitrosopumilales archaeon]
MSLLIQKIDELIEQHSLLKHQFYQMWSDGKLSQESLSGYSKEYFQLVKQVPSFVASVAKYAPQSNLDELRANQKEESEHIVPWTRFAKALGVSESELERYEGLEKTKKAISEMSSLMGSIDGGAAAMYALEKEIPKISQTKLEGLNKFYGITDYDATQYFELHKEADIRHAKTWQKILERNSQNDKLIKIAERSLLAQNLLLDGCYETYC